MKEAIWVLTAIANSVYWEHSFTCSRCGRTVSEMDYLTDSGDFDMTSVSKELMKDYPFCHCGAKMKKDPQLQDKMAQHHRSERDWKNYVKTYQGEPVVIKNRWSIDEIVVSSNVPF